MRVPVTGAAALLAGKPEMENAAGSTSSPGLKSGDCVLHVVEREEKRHA
jgi:hypothetical protein